VEQFDIQEIKNRFSFLMENALADRQEDPQEIDILLQEYPYCQPLHILKAVSSKTDSFSAEKHIAEASLYAANRRLLHQIIHHPETIAEKFAAASIESIDTSSETAAASAQPEQPEEPINREVFMVETPETRKEENPAGTEDETAVETVIPEQERPKIMEVQQLLPEEEQSGPEFEQAASGESPIFDNVASSDYFTFDKSSADPLLSAENPDQEETETAAIEASSLEEKENTETSTSDSVSKYNDDKLPYTFLWWLHKTRREHASTYQPYASSSFVSLKNAKKNTSPELNQQIIENIFHLQVPLKDEQDPEKLPAQTVEFQIKKKDESLIERFIKEEPQIQPPKPEKIDTENKARRSSEDNYDLVSETLASIYIDQMLYHKAIDTYKKLSLKFPEKKLYFAGRIQELQNKIN